MCFMVLPPDRVNIDEPSVGLARRGCLPDSPIFLPEMTNDDQWFTFEAGAGVRFDGSQNRQESTHE